MTAHVYEAGNLESLVLVITPGNMIAWSESNNSNTMNDRRTVPLGDLSRVLLCTKVEVVVLL
jgi:hypothetical protein